MLTKSANKMTSDSPLLARVVLGIVAALALSIPFAIVLNDAHKLELLEKTARTMDGTVKMKNCENHGKLFYSYVVDGRVYTGSGTIPDKSCDDVKVGDRIDILYSAQKPALSRSDSFASWRDNISGSLFALVLLSLGAAVVIFRITRVDTNT